MGLSQIQQLKKEEKERITNMSIKKKCLFLNISASLYKK